MRSFCRRLFSRVRVDNILFRLSIRDLVVLTCAIQNREKSSLIPFELRDTVAMAIGKS